MVYIKCEKSSSSKPSKIHMQALHPCYYPEDVPEKKEGLSYTSPVEKSTHTFI
jgi:hypothetical protein